MKFIIGCEIFIFDESKRLLLGKRKNCYGEGTWALPGGHLEHGETIYACVARELKEELTIEATDLQLVCITEDIGQRGHHLHMSFVLDAFNGIIINNEPDKCEVWQYFDVDELPQPLFAPHQKILKTFFEKKLYVP